MTASLPSGADLIVRLYELRLRDPYRSAARWLDREFLIRGWTEVEHRYPQGSDHHDALRLVIEHWELVGALVAAGDISEHLLFDSTGEFLSVWSKVEPWLEEARAALEEPRLFENLQYLIERHERWLRSNPPKRARRARLLS